MSLTQHTLVFNGAKYVFNIFIDKEKMIWIKVLDIFHLLDLNALDDIKMTTDDQIKHWQDLIKDIPPSFGLGSNFVNPKTAFMHEYAIYAFLDKLIIPRGIEVKHFFVTQIIPIIKQIQPQLLKREIKQLESRHDYLKQKITLYEKLTNDRKELLQIITDKIQSITKTFNVFTNLIGEGKL
ncbi:hypothetical protein DLEV_104 [Diachasmimorpha longicaudata entomopoxvirus]|uniref:Uncharacterized protein n=1 Tax=Diachasmimorpha longicaudata entomopoxvirus TaxID=109981 RepID=A0A7R5WFA2_9POXV|nr:hypothetical protein QKK69_gp104 [Diachasmimorpha longicaudata entomopoxvirus]AKS26395.1 hypothetical protein DLEV_104 [Diachasmimorpha longicaudata entomopoxvirus]